MNPYTLSAFVTICTSVLIFILAYNVWAARLRHKVQPYEDTKEKDVLIANRIHMNTIEQTVVFLPLLWVATVFSSANIAGLLACIWFISRIGYALIYKKQADKRYIPFMVGMFCILCMSILAFYGILFNS